MGLRHENRYVRGQVELVRLSYDSSFFRSCGSLHEGQSENPRTKKSSSDNYDVTIRVQVSVTYSRIVILSATDHPSWS
jgi:hypothetical protein